MCATILPLTAHDIYSSWTEAKLTGDRLELTLTLARASAVRLLADEKTVAPITPENFSSYESKLRAVAPELFEIVSGAKRLELKSAKVAIAGDADIIFELVFPRPLPGKLQFQVQYLFRLVDGHVGTLVLSDATGNDLGWSPVSVDQPTFEVRVPGPAPGK